MLLGSSIPVSLGSVEKQGFGCGVGGSFRKKSCHMSLKTFTLDWNAPENPM